MKLSIIVPVYGVEKYILQFAESLIFQLNNEVELIIINDGTKDRSIKILTEYVTENFIDKNIIWLEQENQGQSVARNYGISVATGKYITFLDPDDYVGKNYVFTLLNNIDEYINVDLYQFNAYVIKNNQVINELKLAESSDEFILNNCEIIKILKKRMWFSWLRVIRKDLLDNNFFPIGVNFQDMMAFPKLYKKVKSIKNINTELVYYRIHEQSSVHKFSEKLIHSLDHGIFLYENHNCFIDKIMFRQFLSLRLLLSFQNLGYKVTKIWYCNNFDKENKSYYIYYYCLSYSLIKKIYYMVKR